MTDMTLSQKVVSKLNLLTVNHITSIIVIIEVEWNVEGFVVVSALESTRGQNVTSAGREGASGEALEETCCCSQQRFLSFSLLLFLSAPLSHSFPACFLRLAHTAKASYFHTRNCTNTCRVPRGLPWTAAQIVHCTELGGPIHKVVSAINNLPSCVWWPTVY